MQAARLRRSARRRGGAGRRAPRCGGTLRPTRARCLRRTKRPHPSLRAVFPALSRETRVHIRRARVAQVRPDVLVVDEARLVRPAVRDEDLQALVQGETDTLALLDEDLLRERGALCIDALAVVVEPLRPRPRQPNVVHAVLPRRAGLTAPRSGRAAVAPQALHRSNGFLHARIARSVHLIIFHHDII